MKTGKKIAIFWAAVIFMFYGQGSAGKESRWKTAYGQYDKDNDMLIGGRKGEYG